MASIHGAIGRAIGDLVGLSQSGAWDFGLGLQHPALNVLRREVAACRIAWTGIMHFVPVPMASSDVCLQEAMVKFAIVRCRKAGVSETEIAAVLGEYGYLSRDGWDGLVGTAVRRCFPWQVRPSLLGYD